MIDTASGFGIDERSHITVTEFVAQSYGSTHREERKAQPQKSLNSKEIIRTRTRISRINRNLSLRGIGHALHALLLMIGRIYTDPGARRLEKAPEHGEAMIVCLLGLNNHREDRVGYELRFVDENEKVSVADFFIPGHREKRHDSVLSVYSVVDRLNSDSFFQNQFNNNKPQMNADKRRYIHVTEFMAQSNRSTHRKVREERKAQPQKSLNSDEIIRTGTQISRIGRICTDINQKQEFF